MDNNTKCRFDDKFREQSLACWRELGGAAIKQSVQREVVQLASTRSGVKNTDSETLFRNRVKTYLNNCSEDSIYVYRMLDAYNIDLATRIKTTWIGDVLLSFVELGVPWCQERVNNHLIKPPRPHITTSEKALAVLFDILTPESPPPSVSLDENDSGNIILEWHYNHIDTNINITVSEKSVPITVIGTCPSVGEKFSGSLEEVGEQLSAALLLIKSSPLHLCPDPDHPSVFFKEKL